MKYKHVPEKIRDEIHHTDDTIKKVIKEAVHKSEDWKDAKKYVQANLELLIYRAEEAIKKICD